MIAPAPAAERQPAAPGQPGPGPAARARVVAGELALGLLFIEGWSALGSAAPWPALVLYAGLMAAAAALFLANPWQASPLYRVLYVLAFGAVAFAVNLLTGSMVRPAGGAWALYLLYFVAASFPMLLFPFRTALLLEAVLWLLFAANVLVLGRWNAAPAGTLHALASLSTGFLFVVVLTLVSRHAHERAAGAAVPASAPGRAEDEHDGAHVRLRSATVQAEEMAAVRERNRMAQEIHDTLGHHLTVLNVQLEAAIRLHGTDQERSYQQLLKAKESAAAALRDVRAAVSTLRPQRFEQGSLRMALEGMVSNFSSATGLPVDLTISGLVRQLPPAEETVLYRAVQEALTNIQKHARASRASVTLRYNPDATDLTVADNGVGAVEPSGGMGLSGIRERVAGVGGTVSIRTKPGAGLILHVSIPAAMPTDGRAPRAAFAATGAREE